MSKKPKRVDLSTVVHTLDGRLLATSCDSAHFDLLGPNDEIFATMLVPSEMFLEVASRLCEFNEHVRAKLGLPKETRQ